MESSNEEFRELTLLENIENDPDVNQSTLAAQLGVAVGTVNWQLKRQFFTVKHLSAHKGFLGYKLPITNNNSVKTV